MIVIQDSGEILMSLDEVLASDWGEVVGTEIRELEATTPTAGWKESIEAGRRRLDACIPDSTADAGCVSETGYVWRWVACMNNAPATVVVRDSDHVKGDINEIAAQINDSVVAWDGRPLTLSEVYQRWSTGDEGFWYGCADLISDHPWGVFFEEVIPACENVGGKKSVTLWFQKGMGKFDKVRVSE